MQVIVHRIPHPASAPAWLLRGTYDLTQVPPGAKPGWGKHEGTERKVDLVYIKAHRLANRYPGKKIHVHAYVHCYVPPHV